VIFQSRVPVEFAALEGESESGFMRDQYFYGVRARYNVGYGLWQSAFGSQVA
jgi:phage major head subunit gpT-like protein